MSCALYLSGTLNKPVGWASQLPVFSGEVLCSGRLKAALSNTWGCRLVFLSEHRRRISSKVTKALFLWS